MASVAVLNLAGFVALAQSAPTPIEATTRPAADPAADSMERLRSAIKRNKFEEALALMDELEPTLPEPDYYVASNRFRVLIKSRRYDAAYRYLGKVENLPNITGQLLNELALIITDTKNVKERDLIAAKRLARHALAIGENWPGYSNTLARAYFVNGEYEMAVTTETDALDRAPERWKSEFTRILEKYRAALDDSTKAPTTMP